MGEWMREVTDEEVAHYQDNGWAKLEGLISRDLAADILASVHDDLVGEAEARPDATGSEKPRDRAQWRDLRFPGRDRGIEPLRSLIYSKDIGLAAQRFIGRDVPINYHADIIAVKMPQGHLASRPTGWHQDWVNFPFDRAGFLSFWIALEDMPAERGVMRFMSGSQKAGPLGKYGVAEDTELPDVYPNLTERYPVSEAFGLKAGDATVHDALVVHSAPGNATDRPRFTAILSYHPADTRFTGAPHYIFTPDLGLEVDKPIKHDLFRVVYP
jgi:ectoine hydroxylase-related dioxygenase (phytanoyl-CoA dioxygenase family)